MDILLQYANQVKRGCRHTWKAARRLNSVRESLQRNAEGEVIESKVSDQTNIELLKDAQQTLADNEESPVTESESRTLPAKKHDYAFMHHWPSLE